MKSAYEKHLCKNLYKPYFAFKMCKEKVLVDVIIPLSSTQLLRLASSELPLLAALHKPLYKNQKLCVIYVKMSLFYKK